MKRKITEAEAIASLKQKLDEVTVDHDPSFEDQVKRFPKALMESVDFALDYLNKLPRRILSAIINFVNRRKKANESINEGALDFIKTALKSFHQFIWNRIAELFTVTFFTLPVLGLILEYFGGMPVCSFLECVDTDASFYMYRFLWQFFRTMFGFVSGGGADIALPGLAICIAIIALIMKISSINWRGGFTEKFIGWMTNKSQDDDSYSSDSEESYA